MINTKVSVLSAVLCLANVKSIVAWLSWDWRSISFCICCFVAEGFFMIFLYDKGFEHRRTLDSLCSFRSPKDAGLSSPDFGGWRVFSANCGITWQKWLCSARDITYSTLAPEPAYHFCTTSPSVVHSAASPVTLPISALNSDRLTPSLANAMKCQCDSAAPPFTIVYPEGGFGRIDSPAVASVS